MMDSEKKRFLESINAVAAVYRTAMTEMLLRMYWEAMKDYAIQDVAEAFMTHVKTGKFFPVPSEIIDIIGRRTSCQHLGADEAWVIVRASFDESETVVMTQVMKEARKAVYPLWVEGDAVGARMAFREAYSRMIPVAGKPKWAVSFGFDAEKRLSAIQSAQQLGRLSCDYVPNPHGIPAPKATVSVLQLLAMADSKTTETDSGLKKARVGIARMREILNGGGEGSVERRAKERQVFETHREAELSKVAQRCGDLH